MEILRADKNDLVEILQIQHMAFQKEAEQFDDFHIEPMTQTIDILKE